MTGLRGAVICVLLAGLAGCGGGGGGGSDAGTEVRLPAGVRSPNVLALSIDPADGAVFVSTDKGLLRIARGAERATLVRGTYKEGLVKVPLRRDSPVTFVGPHRLLGSGHPGARGPVPQNLGLLVSTDAGRTWGPVSLTGDADLHALRTAIGASWLYAFDYANGKVVYTTDHGQTWSTHRSPGIIADLAPDPADQRRVIAVSDHGPVISDDAGANWRPFSQRDTDRVLWPAKAQLYLFDRSGNVRVSKDAGETATLVGTVGASVDALYAVGPTDLYAATSDDRIRRSRDGGRGWATAMRLVAG